jgi:hypothetical protein
VSNNLEVMLKIAWTNNHPRKHAINLGIDSLSNVFATKTELPRNYCEYDLDVIYNPCDWFEDTWWKP